MRGTRLLIMALMLFAMLLLTCSSGSKHQEVKIGTEGFSVETPVTLKEEPVHTIDVSFGKVDLHLFSADRGSKSYFAAYYDYPPDYVSKVQADRILDERRDGMMGSITGKLISQRRISLDGNPGRELEVSADTKQGEYLLRSRLFLVRNRIYHIMVTTPKNVTDSSDVKFLNSFKLLGK